MSTMSTNDPGPDSNPDIYYDIWILLRKIGISDGFMKEFERITRDKLPLISGAECNLLQIMRNHYSPAVMVESALQTDGTAVIDQALQTDLLPKVPEVDGTDFLNPLHQGMAVIDQPLQTDLLAKVPEVNAQPAESKPNVRFAESQDVEMRDLSENPVSESNPEHCIDEQTSVTEPSADSAKSKKFRKRPRGVSVRTGKRYRRTEEPVVSKHLQSKKRTDPPSKKRPEKKDTKKETKKLSEQKAPKYKKMKVEPPSPSSEHSTGREMSFATPPKRQLFPRPKYYAYPKWLTDVYAAPSPYFPQMGDVVYYFRRRHELYFKEMFRLSAHRGVKRRKEELDANLPHQDLGDMEKFRVEDVQFITKDPDYIPYSEIQVRRLPIEEDTGNQWGDGATFTIRYQDVRDVEDVFVLAQLVDRSKKRNFQIGNRVRAVFEEKGVRRWSNGKIQEISHDERELMSVGRLNSISVVLDSRAKEMNVLPDASSPWDLVLLPKEEIENGKALKDGYEDGAEVTRSELRNMAYSSATDDWGGDPHIVVKRIRVKLEDVMLRPETKRFHDPVDLEEYPDYYRQIAYPMDMGTVLDRLKYGFYRRKAALLYDIRQLRTNAKTFDGFQDEYIKNAEIIAAICEDVVANPGMGVDVDEVWDRKRTELHAKAK